jgi:hypothetical protein
MKTLIAGITVLLMSVSAYAAPIYVSGQWDTDSVAILDENFAVISSFGVAANPNGVTSDGNLIFSGHFLTQEVIAYDLVGTEQYRWGAPISGLQGMAFVDGELAIHTSGNIDFYDPLSGALQRSFSSPVGSSIEGLAYDGSALWAIADSLVSLNPITGSQNASIANAAANCSFNGTGIATAGSGQLALACTTGDWFVVSDVDGSIISSGNNGLNMYGLGNLSANSLPEDVPAPATLALFGLGLAGLGFSRRRK